MDRRLGPRKPSVEDCMVLKAFLGGRTGASIARGMGTSKANIHYRERRSLVRVMREMGIELDPEFDRREVKRQYRRQILLYVNQRIATANARKGGIASARRRRKHGDKIYGFGT